MIVRYPGRWVIRRRSRAGLQGPSSSNPGVNAAALAIAAAEGFGQPGAKPTRQNNPGDITSGGAIATYPTEQAGWDALTHQLELIASGSSGVYNPNMTLAQAGTIYAGGDPNWAVNVGAQLGVDPNSTTLAQILTSGSGVPGVASAGSSLDSGVDGTDATSADGSTDSGTSVPTWAWAAGGLAVLLAISWGFSD